MAFKEKREKVEALVYKIMDSLDKTGQNTEYYKKKFAKMNDKKFMEFFKQDFPLKFQTKVFEIDPKIEDIIYTCEQVLKVPVEEPVNLPFLYRNKDGVSVKSKPSPVVYLPIKRLKQMVQKKQGFSVDISKRAGLTMQLIDHDKNAQTTDREIESLAVYQNFKTMKEFTTYRADAMNAKSKFYSEINAKGDVKMSEVPVENDDSVARHLISAYLLGCHINSNLINKDCYLPRTLARKNAGQRGIIRS